VSVMRRPSFTTFETVFGVAHLTLATNLALLLGCLPLVVLLLTTDPALSWPLLALVAPTCAPALVAAFTVFRERGTSEDGIARTFARGMRQGWRPALTLGAVTTGAVVVLLVDIRYFADAGGAVGALVVPVLVLLTVLVVATVVLALVAVSEEPTARLRDVVRASLYLAVRRWYLSAGSLGVLSIQLAFLTSRPALAIGLTATPLLYVVWANARYTLTPVLAHETAPVVTA